MDMVLRSSTSESKSKSKDKDESVFTVESASKWKTDTTKYMNIKVKDVRDMFLHANLPNDAKYLIIPEWENGEWLRNVDIRTSQYSNKIKTLIGKIKKVFMSEEDSITEVIVDGFIESLLHILCFDDYPCFLYPQYSYLAQIGPNNRRVQAKPDFSVLSEGNKIMLVIEDKTVTSATYSNNWKEDQVMGELFAAVHYVVTKSRTTITYPIAVYAVRVIGTNFTFYKAVATLNYIKESARLGFAADSKMVVDRCPPVEDNPSRLTAYNICNVSERLRILECLCSIRQLIAN